MSTRHEIFAEYPEEADGSSDPIECTITYTFSPGAPEQGPSYASGGRPADPPEIEFVSVRAIHGLRPDGFEDMAQLTLDSWAEMWLYDHLDEACDRASQDRYDDRCEAEGRRAEVRRERLMEDRE